MEGEVRVHDPEHHVGPRGMHPAAGLTVHHNWPENSLVIGQVGAGVGIVRLDGLSPDQGLMKGGLALLFKSDKFDKIQYVDESMKGSI